MSSWYFYYTQIIGKVGGIASCVGSGYILQDVLRNPDKRTKSIYHRIMLGLSITDIISSIFIFILGSWPMPTGSWLWAAGNIVICDVTAFLGLLGAIGSMMYNCSLATFYLLQLKFNWPDRKMKAIEKLLHIVPCILSFAFCIVIFSTKMFGPHVGHCWISLPYPRGCDQPESEVECIRGAFNNRIYYLAINLINLLCIIYVSASMFFVYTGVRNIEIRAEKYSFMARFQADKKKTRKRSRRVMLQGILYSAAMVLLWIFTAIRILHVLILKRDNVVLAFISDTITPIQGLFNALIYMTPVFRKMLKTRRQRKENQHESINTIMPTSTTLQCQTSFALKKSKKTGGIDRGGKEGEENEYEQEDSWGSVKNAFHPESIEDEENGDHHVINEDHESDNDSTGDDYY
jgi:hypothetical protein